MPTAHHLMVHLRPAFPIDYASIFPEIDSAIAHLYQILIPNLQLFSENCENNFILMRTVAIGLKEGLNLSKLPWTLEISVEIKFEIIEEFKFYYNRIIELTPDFRNDNYFLRKFRFDEKKILIIKEYILFQNRGAKY
ncbi:hypothetical protein BpHYR1_029374 [Brachionus plicatilis]|uniref:Uncharacterized protein n=1 Tax=Brachionus plicatilis TaxID=10195 RepID=A0A3M7PAH6_BRAPC|nr:hypothetical protein BpHYR1_029374 [Brachionus plicatilis]